MQNSYLYWRAAHPMVFISAHLVLGYALSTTFVTTDSLSTIWLVIIIFTTSLFILYLLCSQLIHPNISAAFISLSLVSWGIALQLISKEHPLFSIPYPKQLISYCRNVLINKINKTIVSKEANGFAQAILFGVKTDMNQSLVTAYTQLGIIHIIAISGMHLEILFKHLKGLTQWLPKQNVFLLLELFVLLIAVWMYTLMAFASPSIVRASVFFTLYTLGNYWGAKSFMLNTIAAGIFLLLLFDAEKVNHIGLQLSYAAVIGIHLFYKPLLSIIALDNPMVQFLWSNCCISTAAQITTLPILLLHFHQIASWVLVSNFIMIPLSNYILYGLAILLLLPTHFGIASIWGRLIEKYILFFNGLVQNWFLYTKASSFQISMNLMQVIIYYIILLFIYLWLYLKQTSWLLCLFGVLTVCFLLKLFS